MTRDALARASVPSSRLYRTQGRKLRVADVCRHLQNVREVGALVGAATIKSGLTVRSGGKHWAIDHQRLSARVTRG